jgi:hypothetical protein
VITCLVTVIAPVRNSIVQTSVLEMRDCNMPNRTLMTGVILALLAVYVVACAAPIPEPSPTAPPPTPTATPVPATPTPETREPNYSSDSLALSLWYPETWSYEDMPDAAVFASSRELISSEDWHSGAAFAALCGELEDEQTIKDLLRQTVEASAFEQLDMTELEPSAIGGARGVITNIEATTLDASAVVKGFVAGVEYNGRAYLFMGLSVKDDWPEFGQTLEAMLHSIRFTEPEGTFTSEELDLRLWYPDGWIVEEEYDQVLFATSTELIESGELRKGAVLFIRRASLDDICLKDWFLAELEALTFDEGGINSDMAYRTVADQEGLIVDLWGVPSGSSSTVTGFAVAIEHDESGYLIVGISADNEWSQYYPTLEKMLDSVQFPDE